MSAAAVVAVRPGLRIAFSRASRPVMPRMRSIGLPASEASGRTSRGENSEVANRISAAPPPRRPAAVPESSIPPNRPKSISTRPSTPKTERRDRRGTPARLRVGQLGLAQRRHRRDARRAQRRCDRREQGHYHADEQRDDHGPAGHDRARVGKVDADRLEELVDAEREAEPAGQAGERAEQPEDERLEPDRRQDLAARRAERAQHPELARPLRDSDRERVEDLERAHEQRHAREHEQRDTQEAEVARDVVRLALSRLGPGLDDQVRRDDLRDPVTQLHRRHPLGRGDRDLVELAHPVGHALGLRQRHLRDARAAEVAVAELREPDDVVALDLLGARNPELVANGQVGAVRRLGVDRRLRGVARLAAVDVIERLETGRQQRGDEVGSEALRQCVAVLVYELADREDGSGGGLHALHARARGGAATRRRRAGPCRRRRRPSWR